jgi:hypothetical protein
MKKVFSKVTPEMYLSTDLLLTLIAQQAGQHQKHQISGLRAEICVSGRKFNNGTLVLLPPRAAFCQRNRTNHSRIWGGVIGYGKFRGVQKVRLSAFFRQKVRGVTNFFRQKERKHCNLKS